MAERKSAARMSYAGAAFIALSSKYREDLELSLGKTRATAPPVEGLKLKVAEWVKPHLIAGVRHPHGAKTLRHATVKVVKGEATSL